MLLRQTDERTASGMAERLRAELAGLVVPTQGGEHVAFTVSIGVAEWREPAETLESLLARADGALYGAKHAGRNTITVARAA